VTAPAPVELHPGADFRRREYRREVWQRFYTFHLRYRSHPGGVYYVLPALAEAAGWDEERRAWAAFLNGNTQNPVTTWLLMQAGDHPSRADAVLEFWRNHYPQLAWDTDRRYHKARLDVAVAGYLDLTRNGQATYWRKAAAGGWAGVWAAANAIPTMGRLSAWSYLEYLRLLGVGNVPDADTLLLGDRDGSRSHRNGLALVLGMDEWIWWDTNPGFTGRYPPDVLQQLATGGAGLLAEARTRNPGVAAVGYLTLESALCTYKSWHRPRRRYPNVYNDLLYDRLRHAGRAFGARFEQIWQARRDNLPSHLLLEETPYDPGCVPAKQDHYRLTGQVIMMEHDWPCFANGFAEKVNAGAFGLRP
jgi:hypothetical protein